MPEHVDPFAVNWKETSDIPMGQAPAEADVWASVAKGIARGDATGGSLSVGDDSLVGSLLEEGYDATLDFAGAELLAQVLANKLARFTPDALVVWDNVEDVILGFLTARRLGIRLVRAYERDGLLRLVREGARINRVALVRDMIRHREEVLGIQGVMARAGAALIAVAVLVRSTPAEQGVPLVHALPESGM